MDTPKNGLKNNYEDALFALLMDDLAEEEGARLIEENKCLRDDPDFVLPEEFDIACKLAIKRGFAEKKKASRKKLIKRNLLRVAGFVIAVATIFSGLYLSVSAVRENVSSIFKSIRDMGTVIKSEEQDSIMGEVEPYSALPDDISLPIWLPDGFALSSYSNEDDTVYAVFCDANGNQVVYKKTKVDALFSLDTENADIVEYIEIGDNEGAFVDKEGITSITWFDSVENMSIRIKTQGLDRETVIKIANSVSNS